MAWRKQLSHVSCCLQTFSSAISINRCTFRFPRDWACSSPLSLDGQSFEIGRTFESTLDPSLHEITSSRVERPSSPTTTAYEDSICVNTNCVEDTDLFFMFKEYPPPTHLASVFVSSHACLQSQSHQGYECIGKKSFALFQQGAWEFVAKGSIFRPLSQPEMEHFCRMFPLLLQADQRESTSGWERYRTDFKSVRNETHAPSPSPVTRTSMHERLELVLRGHTNRLPSHLFLSLQTISSMKLSLVRDPQWFLRDRNSVRAYGSQAPSRSNTNTAARSAQTCASQPSKSLACPPSHFITVDELIQLGKP